MERLDVPNKGYQNVLMECSHAHEYLGTWPISNAYMYARDS